MPKIPSKFDDWKSMAEAIKFDAMREHEDFVAACAEMLEKAIFEAEQAKKAGSQNGLSNEFAENELPTVDEILADAASSFSAQSSDGYVNIGDLTEFVSQVEAAETTKELTGLLQCFVEDRGFKSYSFVENGSGSLEGPLSKIIAPELEGSSGMEAIFKAGSLQSIDLDKLIDFDDEAIRKIKTFGSADMAADEDLEIEFHYRDQHGVFYSANCGLLWDGKVTDFKNHVRFAKTELQLVLIFWAERVVAISNSTDQEAVVAKSDKIHLTDYEKDVLSYAAQGKNIKETSNILGIAAETANGYMENAIGKFDAVNSTQAVSRAISGGFIRI